MKNQQNIDGISQNRQRLIDIIKEAPIKTRWTSRELSKIVSLSPHTIGAILNVEKDCGIALVPKTSPGIWEKFVNGPRKSESNPIMVAGELVKKTIKKSKEKQQIKVKTHVIVSDQVLLLGGKFSPSPSRYDFAPELC